MAEQKAEHKDITVPSSTPTKDTFNLDDFIQKKSTVPTVGVTVYLDAEGGRQYQEKVDRVAEIDEKLESLNSEDKPVLGISETNPVKDFQAKLTKEKSEAEKAIDSLKERVLASALYVEFQCADLKIPSRAHAAAADELPDADDAAQRERAISYMMAEMVVRVSKADGQTNQGPLGVDTMQSLRDKLIVVEGIKLVEGMNEALMVSNEWTAHIDAGFPGRSTHVAS